MEKWLHLEDARDIYLARHLATHLFFLLGVFCGYLLAWRLFKDRFIACLAFLMLAFHPRIYAHSFFNTKDIPFLAAFLIALFIFQIAFENNKAIWYLILGIACGYATSIRAMGIIFIPTIGLFFVIDLFRAISRRERSMPVIRNALLWGLGLFGMLYLCWPILWSNPIFYFIESFRNLANIKWNGEVLFNGNTYKGDQLPWNYLPVWFSITMPELWLAAGVAGIAALIVGFVKHPKNFLLNTQLRNFTLYLACFSGPIIAMIVFHGVNIDDWRHLYFIYPAFVMMALFAINNLAKGRRRMIIYAFCALQMLATGLFMYRNHPYQQVYFSHLVSQEDEYLRKHYDMDYWGVAYKQGFEYILSHDTATAITIHGSYGPVMNNVMFLPKTQRDRIILVGDEGQPDYFLTNFRMHPNEYAYPMSFYEVKVLNSTILKVYKLH
jgi:4-amino-4-deoxy-L-arabinose transferase-like glycosyltransferase